MNISKKCIAYAYAIEATLLMLQLLSYCYITYLWYLFAHGYIIRGVHPPPETMMHFPPVSDFPPIFKKLSDSVENFLNFTFSGKIS